MVVFYILLAILLFGILILVHEFGHFITAKLSGVRVNEFSLFMGPAIWKKQKGDTLYALRTIPIGGYCAMEGEDGDSEDPRAFGKAKLWKKLIILVAGSLMNLVAGFLIMLIFVSIAYDAYIPGTQVGSIEEGRPFYSETGLQPGDTFYEIDGERIYVNADVSMFLGRESSGVHDITVLRDGEKLYLEDIEIKRDFLDSDGSYRYGFTLLARDRSFGTVLSYTYHSCRDFVRLVRLGLQDLLTGKAGFEDTGGPVLIVKTVVDSGMQSESVGIGVLNVLYLFAFIAINLAVMNLLPIPALDGGRVVCLLLTAVIEKILRRKLNPKYEAYLHAGFMILLLGFMAVITFKDVFQLFK